MEEKVTRTELCNFALRSIASGDVSSALVITKVNEARLVYEDEAGNANEVAVAADCVVLMLKSRSQLPAGVYAVNLTGGQ